MRRSIFAALAIGFGLAALPAMARAADVKADLNGASETPPNDSKGTGALTGTYDSSSKKLTWSVTYSGLTGPVTAAHFHGPAPAGKAAGIEVPLNGPFDSPMKGSATLTASQEKDLMAGNMYFNLHTAAHKPGEVRGQVSVSQ